MCTEVVYESNISVSTERGSFCIDWVASMMSYFDSHSGLQLVYKYDEHGIDNLNLHLSALTR